MKNHINFASFFANILDNKFKLLGFRFGITAIIDLVPGLGDILNVLLSCFIVLIALRMDIPKAKIVTMIGNILFCFLIGLIPVLGDAVYILYKPNTRNVILLKKYVKV